MLGCTGGRGDGSGDLSRCWWRWDWGCFRTGRCTDAAGGPRKAAPWAALLLRPPRAGAVFGAWRLRADRARGELVGESEPSGCRNRFSSAPFCSWGRTLVLLGVRASLPATADLPRATVAVARAPG